MKMPREKYMLEAEKSSARLHFMGTLRDGGYLASLRERPSRKILAKLST